jgi:GNAT superfamily N-acetyltransferase
MNKKYAIIYIIFEKEIEKMGEEIIEIIEFTEKYLSPVCDLANNSFGNGYLTEKKYGELISKESALSVALHNGQFAGFCFLIHEKAEEVAKGLKIDISQIKPYADERGLVCHAKAIAVVPEFRRTGLTDKLFAETLKKSAAKGMRSVWVAAWKMGDRVPAKKTLENNGFSVSCEKEMLWFDDKEYECIACGGACRCNGIIYYKIFNEEVG